MVQGFWARIFASGCSADGHEVICLDNFFTGRRENIAHLMNDANFELLRHDVIEPILLEVDQIYNLACPASPIHYQYNPVKTVKTSVMGTINMLGLAKRVHARILQASTSEVYGNPQVHPQTEDYWGYVNPIGVRSCYDEGKRLAETLMMDYHRQNQVDTRIARIFNTYGPRMLENDGRVVSNFIVQTLRGRNYDLWQRQPDPIVLLCFRFDRRFDSLNECRWSLRSDQPGQCPRIHDQGTSR